jgi:hypothetical protein
MGLTLTTPEKQAVEVVDGRLKPKDNVACYLLTKQTIKTVNLDTGQQLFWHATEGAYFDQLLPYADEEDDE